MWNIELYLGPLCPASRLLQHIIISTLLSLPLALYKGRIYPRLGSGGIFPFPAKSHMVCVLCIISLKWFPSLATRSLAPARKLRQTRIPSRFHHPRNYHWSSKKYVYLRQFLFLKPEAQNPWRSYRIKVYTKRRIRSWRDDHHTQTKFMFSNYWNVLNFRTLVCYVTCAEPCQASWFRLLSSRTENTAHSFRSPCL